MDSPDLNIIHSPEAARMLQMVTKDFYATSYYGLWLFEVIGREWDEVREWTQGLRYEIFPQTCTWTIAIWEWVYGFEPDNSLSLQFRRQRILSRIIGRKPLNPEVIRQSVMALTGMDVDVNDFVSPYCFDVLIHYDDTKLDRLLNNKYIRQHIRSIKPSHLSFNLKWQAALETQVFVAPTSLHSTRQTLPPAYFEITSPQRAHTHLSGTNYGSISQRLDAFINLTPATNAGASMSLSMAQGTRQSLNAYIDVGE